MKSDDQMLFNDWIFGVHRNAIPDYVLLLQEPPPLFIDKSLSGDMGTYDFYPMPRSSLHSVRKASYDVRSLGSDGIVTYFPFSCVIHEEKYK